MIHIVDYGMGNLRSVQKAFERLGHEAKICGTAEELDGAERMVLPGVGAFRDAIAELKRLKMDEPVRDHIAADKPFLGICLGLQLLFDVGFEDGEWPGLGIVGGNVVRFENHPERKVPHMGWNSLESRSETPLLTEIPPEAHFYFVHSYYVVPDDDAVVASRTDYGLPFVSAITRGRMFATQFHPEKSQRVGLRLLENFTRV